MRAMRMPKVGLVGVMCTPFRGDKESQYKESSSELESLAERFGFCLRVIPDGLYELEQAQSAAAELTEWGADLILVQTSSFAPGEFIYPFAEQSFYLGLWAVPEGPPTEEGGLPFNSFTAANMYNSILGTFHRGYKRPVKWFYGPPGQDLFDDRLAVSILALRALVNLRGARIGLIGGVAPGFDNLIIDEGKLFERFKIRVQHIEIDEIIQRAGSIEEALLGSARDTFRNAAAYLDSSQDEALDKSGRVYLAYKDIAETYNLDALAVSCWPRFQSDYQLAVCSVMAMVNAEGLIAACEGDVTSATSMLALKYMSDGNVVTLMDLVTLDEEDQSILLWHCGPTAPALADEKGVRMQPLWLFDGYEGDPIGLHNDLVLRPGKATVMGFTTDFERMLVLDGEFDNTKPSYVGSRGWFRSLHLNGESIEVRDLVQTLMGSYFQHHYPVVYGGYVSACLELATWLGVSPIAQVPYKPFVTSHLIT